MVIHHSEELRLLRVKDSAVNYAYLYLQFDRSRVLLNNHTGSDIIMQKARLINLLNLTGHVMHQQFNIQQLYVLPTLCLFVLYLSENKQRLVPVTAKTDWFL